MVAPTILNYMEISIPKEMKETRLLFDRKWDINLIFLMKKIIKKSTIYTWFKVFSLL
jgi:hypothetical protein